MEYLTYDPNYNYDDDVTGEDGESGGTMETEEDNEEDAEDEYSDDDDMSWKVRRAATKCLEAVIASRRELLCELYKGVSPVLISRFKGELILNIEKFLLSRSIWAKLQSIYLLIRFL